MPSPVAAQYLDDFKVKNLVSRYSEFINFPISIWSSKTTYEQARPAATLVACCSLSLSLSLSPSLSPCSRSSGRAH